ncbi:MAG TPA: hypothetical protein VLZ11_04570 [Flavobacterium sp.]|nr:hypothetical protein [Flavobacterium sp.]
MKTIQVKKIMMPLAIILIGIMGALSTHAMNKSAKSSTHEQGYRYVSVLEPCRAEIMCTTDFGDICKLGSTTLWGKTTDTAPCNVPLYKINN